MMFFLEKKKLRKLVLIFTNWIGFQQDRDSYAEFYVSDYLNERPNYWDSIPYIDKL